MPGDTWIRVGEHCAVVGTCRRRRGERALRPPTWLLLGPRSADQLRPTLASGSFRLDAAGDISDVEIDQGVMCLEILPALLEAGRLKWAARRR